MSHTVCKEIFSYDELSEEAKEKARNRWREHALDYEWWDYVYEYAATSGDYLGLDIRQRTVKTMGGGTRKDVSIYFSGFAHQGQGAAFDGEWHAHKVDLKGLKKHAPKDKDLHTIGKTLAAIAKKYPDAYAACSAYRNVNQRVEAELWVDHSDETHSTAEWEAIEAREREVCEQIEEAITGFSHWIFRTLEQEHDYRLSDEAIEEDLQAQGEIFTEDGAVY